MTSLATPKKRPLISVSNPLIDTRMRLFLGRRLQDILDQLSVESAPNYSKRCLRALKRLKTDKYGICEQCGFHIDIARLLTDPATEVCECCESGQNCPVEHPNFRPQPGSS